MFKKISLVVLALVLAVTAFADVPRPDKTPAPKKTASVDTYLSIKLERDAKEAKLIIPRSQLKQLRAELELIDSGDDTGAVSSVSSSRIQTIVSGAFISLAFVFAGIWFTRNGRFSTRGKAAGGAAIVFAFGAFATIVYGNAGPPPEARSITGKMFAQGLHYYKFGGGKIKLEVSDTEETPKLIVPDPEDPKKTDE